VPDVPELCQGQGMNLAARIAGTGSYLPARVMTNAQVCERAPTTDAWIRERLGIETRRIAAPDEQASDMGAAAARKACEAARITPAQVDAIICALGSGDVMVPATAAYVQHKLGITHQCPAFDVRMACAGGLGGMHLARGLLAGGLANHVLVVGTQLGSRTSVDWTDRTTAPIFGDGAGAVVVGHQTAGGGRHILASRLHSDGGLTGIVGQFGGGTITPLSPEMLARGEHFIHMDGKAVWTVAERELPKVAREVVADTGWDISDVDFVVSHQANRRLLLHVLGLLGIEQARTFTNIERYGNTVSASALIALDEAARLGHLKPGMKVLLLAIGAGMTWGGMTVEW
jgi:3-oxoacyl-[acyl-carrier-protein] synthase-3